MLQSKVVYIDCKTGRRQFDETVSRRMTGPCIRVRRPAGPKHKYLRKRRLPLRQLKRARGTAT